TFALLMEPMRHIGNPLFNAVFIRKNYREFTLPGGIIQESSLIYPHAGLDFRQSPTMEWHGPGRASIYMRHMPDAVADYQSMYKGMQATLLLPDQVEELTEGQFWYLFSRQRGVSGVRPYTRATCNPDPDSFLVMGPRGWGSGLISWWIDPQTGLAIPERSGVIRWFVKRDRDMFWGDTAVEALRLAEKAGHQVKPADAKSLTFIEATLSDNRILLDKDPGYEANLQLQDYVTRQRLIVGNWKVRPAAGLIFKRAWYGDPIDKAPARGRTVRMWDLAGTANAGDYTCGLKRRRAPDGKFYELDLIRKRIDSSQIDDLIAETAEKDGPECWVGLFQDPAQAGKYQVQQLVKRLAGFIVKTVPATKSVLDICRPSSAQAEHGNIVLVRGDWNEEYLHEHENFDGSPKKHDDIIAADAGAMMILATTVTTVISSQDDKDQPGFQTQVRNTDRNDEDIAVI
ncbi:MAG: phage terminase large subunit, partial [Candidatus Gracilibacteria bacterium]|nr:phage terminase large subunit [Candidatus Gracilibacteria bacterium]